MAVTAVVGVDIGTSSSKGVLVASDGTILASATRAHEVSRPYPGHVEMAGEVWWDEFRGISRELLSAAAVMADDIRVEAVGVSGMGPCVLLADTAGTPVRPGILYGVDTRATAQIARLTDELGGDRAVLARCGSRLSTQAVGPKLVWIAENEPEAVAHARRLFMPASFLGFRLTGRYYLDHHSASQCTPLHDAATEDWYRPWAEHVAPWLELPELVWPGEVVGAVTPAAAAETGLPAGIPVIGGTIDAWSEAISVGAQQPGDLMLMYGTTMFLVDTVTAPVASPALWGTVGALPGTRNLAGGMATSGAITAWLRELFGGPDYGELVALAEQAPPGSRGLLMLPYFAGERTPIADPDARGVIVGLTVEHGRGDLYRAALEATAYGIRHNVTVMEDAAGPISRIVAVGGGAQSLLWPQIVTDVTGRQQAIPRSTVGASLGAAFFAAQAVGDARIEDWNPVVTVLEPDPERHERYSTLYERYLELYPATAGIAHALAAEQRRAAAEPVAVR